MGRVKDLWVNADGTKTRKHPANGGNKDAKRWQAEWPDPDGNTKTKVFAKKSEAAAHWKKMEADAERGEYIDPDAGKERVGPLSVKMLRLRKLGAKSRELHEGTLRLHVDPAFAHRTVRSVKPSEIVEWLQGPLIKSYSISVQEAAFYLLRSTFDLAVADKLRRDNPARSSIVPVPHPDDREPREVWEAAAVWRVIDGHPDRYRAVAVCEAGLGLREGCAFGLADEDIDPDAMKVTVRRQVVRFRGKSYFKLPKGGKERTVPLARGVAATIEAHRMKYPPVAVTLPWMNEDGTIAGEPVTAGLLFTWEGPRVGTSPIVAHTYTPHVWYPALHAAGLAPAPERDVRGHLCYQSGGRENGQHMLRHFFETMLDDGGVSMAGQMEFMGHSRRGKVITTAVYGHVTEKTFETARNAIDATLFRLRPVESGGTVTELKAVR